MAKFTDAVVAAQKAKFATGMQPDGADFASIFDTIQEGIEEHDHRGVGDGDAAKITDLACGDRVPRADRRQGGHATDWSIKGTTNYTPTGVRIQCGSEEVSATSPAGAWGTGSELITFPVAFSAKPVVMVTIGDYTALNAKACHGKAGIMKAHEFDLWLNVYDSVLATTATLHWVAIGPA